MDRLPGWSVGRSKEKKGSAEPLRELDFRWGECERGGGGSTEYGRKWRGNLQARSSVSLHHFIRPVTFSPH